MASHENSPSGNTTFRTPLALSPGPHSASGSRPAGPRVRLNLPNKCERAGCKACGCGCKPLRMVVPSEANCFIASVPPRCLTRLLARSHVKNAHHR